MKKFMCANLLAFLLLGCSSNLVIEKEEPVEEKVEETIMEEVPDVSKGTKKEKTNEMEELKTACEEEIEKVPQNSQFSVYIKNLNSAEEIEISPSKMQAASLIKLFIAGSVLEKEKELLVNNSQEELDSLLKSMICYSDNSASNQLINLLGNNDTDQGKRIINEYCLKHQFTNTHIGRLLLQSNEIDDNYTSVKDCGLFLDNIFHETIPGASKIQELLLKQERRTKIPKGIPDTIKVGNKTGELDSVENDVAIVFLEKNPYILCIQSENLVNPSQGRETIVNLSKIVYQYMDKEIK